MRFLRLLKTATLIFLLLAPMTITKLSTRAPSVKSSPSALPTNQSLFMVKFQKIYDYIHRYLNTSTFALENPYFTDAYVNLPERWNLAYCALLLTYAYSFTGDAQYLFEAKYFVDNLNMQLQDTDHYSLKVNTAGTNGWLYADSALLWAMVRLHELGYGNYLGTVEQRVDVIFDHVAINTSQHLGFNYLWYTDTAGGVVLNTYILFSYLLAYMTKQGLANYATEVQKIINGWESRRLPNNLFPYGWDEAYSHDYYSILIIVAEIFLKHLVPSLEVDSTKIQLSIEAVTKSALTAGKPSLAYLAMKNGYTIGQKLRTLWKQYVEDQKFEERTFQNKNAFPAGHRTIMYESIDLVYWYYFDAQTTDYPFAEAGYTKWRRDSVWNYGLNNTGNINRTRITTNYGFGTLFDGVRLTSHWSGVPWDFDSFTYNSTGKFWRGFKEGVSYLSGQNLTLEIYPEMRKVVASRNVINNYTIFPDQQAEFDTLRGNVFLFFPNATSFNVTAISGTTCLNVPTSFAWVTETGYFFVYKMQNYTSTNRRIRLITYAGTGRKLATAATQIEAYPFIFCGTNSSQIKQKQISILQQIDNGTYTWDETLPLAPEGSIKWQLKHYTDISVYTDKNMTMSTFTSNLLTMYVNAPRGQESKTLVYVGELGEPTTVTGATSHEYNSTSNILSIVNTHLSEVAKILVSWAFPPVLSINDSLFMQKFQKIYGYIHKYLNTTNFTLENPYYTGFEFLKDPETNVPERQNLAYFALILTYAYSVTGDVQYLVEAKYFVDNLNLHLYDTIHYSLEVNLAGFTGYLYADSALLLAMVRLHEFGYGDYLNSVRQRINIIFDHAALNTSQFLAWYFVWHGTGDLRPYAYVNFAYLLAYMTKQGLANYTVEVQKIINGWESQRLPNNLHSYGWNGTFTDVVCTVSITTAEIFLEHLLPVLDINSTKIQLSLNAIEASPIFPGFNGEPIGNGDPSLAYLAMKNGYTVGHKMRAQWKQYVEDHRFEERCLQSKNFFPGGHRAVMYGMFDLIYWHYFDAQTTDYPFAEGGYTKWYDGKTWHYGFNNTVGININRVDVSYGFSCRSFARPTLTFWYGWLNSDFDTLTYNSTGKFWRGFKEGVSYLTGQNLTLDIYPEMRKVVASRNVINNSTILPDRQISADAGAVGGIHLYFPNGTCYNVTAISGITYLKVPDYFAWVHPRVGEMFVYKVQNYSDTTNRRIRIDSKGSVKTMSTLLTYVEVYSFKFWVGGWGGNSTSIKAKQMSILQQIDNGTYTWDETFPLAPEGSIKWQLKHYEDISIYTNKNITMSTISLHLLSLNISAFSGQNSTTVIYTGDFGEPTNITGATSYEYDPTTKILTIIKTHSSEAPAQILVDWRVPGDVNGDGKVDILDAGEISAHWYPGPPIGPLGYGAYADINKDGAVNIFDAAIVSAHWGESW